LGNKISIDTINARLAGGKRYTPPEYDDQGPEDDDEESSIGPGMIALMVAMFLGIGGGTFWFMGGEVNTNFSVAGLFDWDKGRRDAALAYNSTVKDQCGQTWVSGQSNVDEMHCFMTSNIIRLCLPEEREHLVAMIDVFDKDDNIAAVEQGIATFQTVGQVQQQSMQIGMEAAKLQNMDPSNEAEMEKFGKQMEKVTRMVDKAQKPLTDVINGKKRNKTSYDQLRADFANLVERGLISSDDLMAKPGFVRDGLQMAKSVRNTCSS
jgi:hypothetical protein